MSMKEITKTTFLLKYPKTVFHLFTNNLQIANILVSSTYPLLLFITIIIKFFPYLKRYDGGCE